MSPRENPPSRLLDKILASNASQDVLIARLWGVVGYDEILLSNPADGIAWCGRARLLFELGRHPEAIKSYDRALERDPTMAAAHSGKAAVFRSLGKLPEALKEVDRCAPDRSESGGRLENQRGDLTRYG
jgi:tetratricopeptide (TPR) repeat protein